MHLVKEPAGHHSIICTKEMNKVLSVGKHNSLLLALDGVAELLGRLQMPPRLALLGLVNVKVGEVAQRCAVLVRDLRVGPLRGKYLASVQQGDEALVPFARARGMVHLDGKARCRLIGLRHRRELENPVVFWRVARHDQQRIVLVAIPGIQGISHVLIPSHAPLQSKGGIALNDDAHLHVDIMPCLSRRRDEDVNRRGLRSDLQVDGGRKAPHSDTL